ncbi:MAG: LmbE family protein [uncultured bacterium]|uniref:LmbE family protein n=1 Tax=Candidatus Daviesbacteria bacterium GW2011_GWC2_40_12 TaxID=1618431 RepID=A0A0G0T6D0_9BACT|nr:MAG: LmbE family protein [uncultured bacterium]KKR17276.1 MAG: LmbE family protein [Candidatus Daviesbacteria bacterium GW2011_GWA2_39_33]KKR42675.1 MAG: LmbE family protein [Candidatus Daviesbacteria bacterium GW2011_GWC2_40_12]OGE21349.1 MAG: hypothetical protein A2778_04240 [Candidatus Daviesbacteria bacterium RIFCSPHIGHO2_01_FULL_40_24]OGE30133.1 MAG: hypothetical protein A3C29_01880 [Candidatus Daviesbacteria bacterium RIFCSPHIGHO2_02_FULL_40_16]OGE43431.1 MAG: hypothetical protein A3A
MNKKILVIAPHPDDEVLGCGGIIKKYSQNGDEVFLAVLTKPYEPDWTKDYIKDKLIQTKKSNMTLGIKKTYSLGFPTVKLDTIPQKKINDELHQVVAEVKPQIVFIPFYGDLNKDHRITCESSLVATRPLTGSAIKKILCYEILSETEWGIEPFKPNVYVDISDNFIIKKKAMEEYKSELKKFPHPRSLEALEALAKKRGSEAGLTYAEAFMLIREIL